MSGMKVIYWSDENPVSREYVSELAAKYAQTDGAALIRAALEVEMPGQVALVSSFGTEASVLLHMAASVDRDVPVIFIDTQKLFPETLEYRDRLIDRLGLTRVSSITPSGADIEREDPDDNLWQIAPDACCHIRKVRPLERALEGVHGWISGRKRYHGFDRSALPLVELSAGRVKFNPLAAYTPDMIRSYIHEHDLPDHPLLAQGYPSVGCACCTSRPVDAANPRSGRWQGRDKTECGIHFAADGTIRRGGC